MSEISSTALLWGFDALELRSVGGPEDRVPHVSERLIRASCLEADLQVAALDTEFFGGPASGRATWMNELAVLPEVIRLAGRLRCPGIIIGSLEDEGDSDDSSVPDAIERIVREAGRLARREGLTLHVRTGSERRAQLVRDVVGPTGDEAVRLLPEIKIGLRAEQDAAAMPADEQLDPERVRDSTYVRLLYRGPESISLDEAEKLKGRFRQIVSGLAKSGFDSDVCLEFERRPEPSTGLRVSTAFVSALNRG